MVRKPSAWKVKNKQKIRVQQHGTDCGITRLAQHWWRSDAHPNSINTIWPICRANERRTVHIVVARWRDVQVRRYEWRRAFWLLENSRWRVASGRNDCRLSHVQPSSTDALILLLKKRKFRELLLLMTCTRGLSVALVEQPAHIGFRADVLRWSILSLFSYRTTLCTAQYMLWLW